jgi:tetratricopeptide (TPR) repeat protein
MKEHIIFNKIEQYKEEVKKKPLLLLPNVLLLTYLALAKRYEELLSYSEQFLMSSLSPCVLVEDFNLLGNIALERNDAAKRIFKNILTLDPEDSYAYLLISMLEQDNYLQLAYLFSQQNERKQIKEITEGKIEIKENYKFYRLPDIIGIKDRIPEKIKKYAAEEPSNPIFKVSLAETLLRLGQIEEAEKELNNILLIYPNYPRALYLKEKIEGDYKGNEEKSTNHLKKIYSLNPVSQYLKGAEVMFLEEKEDTSENELKGIFETDHPFISFFKEHYKKVSDKHIEEVKTEVKENPEVENREEKPNATNSIENGFDALDKKKYTDAIEHFLKELKKK